MNIQLILILNLISQSINVSALSCEKLMPDEIIRYAKDSDRFIAHAGGQIEGHSYTNSVEALNLSYSKGFKKFELDIIKTSDGHYVAAHDWKKWKRMTGFTGETPPTKFQFMNLKILNKFSPMTMQDINTWFKSHSDAILVTDKVKDVEAFSKQFIDKNRLVMEVFNWKSVEIGIRLGIRSVLPTGNLLKKFDGNVVKILLKQGVTEVAVSRKFITSESALLNDLLKTGIKVYAFHVNRKKGKGTDYMICNESHVFYGFYTNSWKKNWQPKC